MTFEPPQVETAPPIAGADILDHPIGTKHHRAVVRSRRRSLADRQLNVAVVLKTALKTGTTPRLSTLRSPAD
jgi:hypothetical protein